MLALSAVMPDAPTRLMFPELLDEGIEPFDVPNLWLGSNEPDVFVDITETIDLKLAALVLHLSQGTGDAEPVVRERAQQMGEQAGYAFAEAFKAFRFVDDDEEA
jgi:LmbE family N-acetylglucosaminyl deacetylase